MLSFFCFICFVYDEVTLDDFVSADNDWSLKVAVACVLRHPKFQQKNSTSFMKELEM